MSNEIIFLTLVRSPEEKNGARLLIESVRQFGGDMSGCPFWLFVTDEMRAACTDLTPLGVELFPLDIPSSIKDYIFSEKVSACSQAEKMAKPETKSFVWIDPNCIVVQPPLLFDLGDSFDAAVRPVHARNVGLTLDDPLDEFWRGIYSAVGVDDVHSAVDSFIDNQHLRSYFNTHAFSFNLRLGLMRKWHEKFEMLVSDSSFQERACKDNLHQVFLFQAILSTLLATSIPAERLRILPTTYNYPYNLYARIPAEKRVKALNELTCFTYEEREIKPDLVTDVEIHEPLRSWIARQV
jgi:hypothetical protein